MYFSQGQWMFAFQHRLCSRAFTPGFLGSGWSVENLSCGFRHTQRNSLLISSSCQIRKIHTLTLSDPIQSQGFHSTDTNARTAGNDRYVGNYFLLLLGERFVKQPGLFQNFKICFKISKHWNLQHNFNWTVSILVSLSGTTLNEVTLKYGFSCFQPKYLK